ncbi:hypothetical protein GCM10007874_08750 [Labrys miyagiensis]|uniref:Uncharacterized protein n=1 Tax=Labrys miyagiensis TaxID=346912 RepID=A0ABQ6CCE8_9HYPH|nr:hypothetical protein [Labrys miyagiensis]GLS17859.1 hypothetical protein GCM10007874_08750 [Labrys miyagiensis]
MPKASTRPPLQERVASVMSHAERAGLFDKESGRIGARVSKVLIEKARARTGLASDTELMKFALASIALEDEFIEALKKVKGTVDPTLKLGY